MEDTALNDIGRKHLCAWRIFFGQGGRLRPEAAVHCAMLFTTADPQKPKLDRWAVYQGARQRNAAIALTLRECLTILAGWLQVRHSVDKLE
jgi:hypothetical protein